jgi:hypothetical protein
MKQTITPTAIMWHSGFYPLSAQVEPIYYNDRYFVSWWKLDNVQDYAIDSHGINNLRASGSPQHCIGQRMVSGIQFDGIDDCFFLPWASGSGLTSRSYNTYDWVYGSGLTASEDYPRFGFFCNMWVDSSGMTDDRFIVSKWNNVGSDREWSVGINPSGGVFIQGKRNDLAQIHYIHSPWSGIMPTDQWFPFGVIFTSDSTDTFIFTMIGQSGFVWNANILIDDVNASGTFCIGVSDYGKSPSGHFCGKMEDIWWINGKAPLMSEWQGYVSGITPGSQIRVGVKSSNPDIGAHFTMDTINSGTFPFPFSPSGGGDISKVRWLDNRAPNGHPLVASGTSSGVLLACYPEVGPLTGTSGLKFQKTTNFNWVANAAHVGSGVSLIPENSFTVMYWCRIDGATDTVQQKIYGGSTSTTSSCGPFSIYVLSQIPQLIPSDEVGIDAALSSRRAIASGLWAHMVVSVDIARGRADWYASGVWINAEAINYSGLYYKRRKSGTSAATSAWTIGYQTTATTANALSGTLDELIQFNYALGSGDIVNFYQQYSGYLPVATALSGMLGGYTNGSDSQYTSGLIGGYVINGNPVDGYYLGGYTSGYPYYASGIIGGYILGPTARSGILGAYMTASSPQDNTIGGYQTGSSQWDKLIGAYVVGLATPIQPSEFYAFFNIIGRNKAEFDSQVQLYKQQNAEFDARAIVYVDELKPDVAIINPAIETTSGTVPLTMQFEAQASGFTGKSIIYTYWYFSDISATSGSLISASGTYQTAHTFAQSGVFDVVFVAVDSQGLINSDKVKIDTASGVTVPTIQLTATPESGTAPLSVAFSGIISTAPYPIIEKYINFGDNTYSASTSSIYKLYPVVGCYIPVFRVRDSRGIIVTDTTLVGVNN